MKVLDLSQIGVILLGILALALLFLGRRRFRRATLALLLGTAVLAEAVYLSLSLLFPH
jgi:hypothetical protein